MTVGPGLVGALLVGIAAAKAVALATGRAARRREPSRGPHLRELPRARAARAAVRVPRGLRRAHDARAHAEDAPLRGARARRSTTPRARPSTRSRGSRAWGSRAGRRSTSSRATGDPDAVALPARDGRLGDYDFSMSRPEDGRAAARARPSRRPGATSTRRISPPRSRRRSSTSRSTRRSRRPTERGVAHGPAGGGVVANTRLRERMQRRRRGGRRCGCCSRRSDLCTDNAAMIACAGASRLGRGRAHARSTSGPIRT